MKHTLKKTLCLSLALALTVNAPAAKAQTFTPTNVESIDIQNSGEVIQQTLELRNKLLEDIQEISQEIMERQSGDPRYTISPVVPVFGYMLTGLGSLELWDKWELYKDTSQGLVDLRASRQSTLSLLRTDRKILTEYAGLQQLLASNNISTELVTQKMDNIIRLHERNLTLLKEGTVSDMWATRGWHTSELLQHNIDYMKQIRASAAKTNIEEMELRALSKKAVDLISAQKVARKIYGLNYSSEVSYLKRRIQGMKSGKASMKATVIFVGLGVAFSSIVALVTSKHSFAKSEFEKMADNELEIALHEKAQALLQIEERLNAFSIQKSELELGQL